jgi:DNA-binding NarL/FixJ family response regulator
VTTVKSHVNSIFRKLDAANRLDAVARAREAGLLDLSRPHSGQVG